MSSTREEACAQQQAYKHKALVAFQCHLVSQALNLWYRAIYEWTTDIVPEADQPDNPGMSGNACRLLRLAHVIDNVWLAAGQAKRAKSGRAARKDAWVNVYRLCSYEVAQTFLRRNDWAMAETRQTEMEL